MTRWRRLCVDVDDEWGVLGASIEYYGDRKVDPDRICVMARSDWSGEDPAAVLQLLLERDWTQPSFTFGPPPNPLQD